MEYLTISMGDIFHSFEGEEVRKDSMYVNLHDGCEKVSGLLRNIASFFEEVKGEIIGYEEKLQRLDF